MFLYTRHNIIFNGCLIYGRELHPWCWQRGQTYDLEQAAIECSWPNPGNRWTATSMQ